MSKVTKLFNATDVSDEQLQAMELAQQTATREQVLQKLDNRYNKNKPFLQQHADTRQYAEYVAIFSHIVSIIGLFYGLKVVLEVFPLWVAIALSIIILIGFEVLKHKYSDKFWDHWWATGKMHAVYFFINFILLFLISMGGSIYGMYFGALDNSPEAKQIGINDDPEAIGLKEQLAKIEDDIAFHKGNKNSQGEVYWPSQQAIKKLEEQRTSITTTLQEKYGIYNIQNEQILTDWRTRTDFRVYALLLVSFLMEIIFEVCRRFISKYDYQVYLAIKKGATASPSPTPPPGGRKSLTPVPGDKLQEQLIREAIREELERSMPGPTSRGAEDSSYTVATSIQDSEILDLAIKRLKADRNAWKSNKGIKEDTRAQKISAIDKKIADYQQRKEQLSATA